MLNCRFVLEGMPARGACPTSDALVLAPRTALLPRERRFANQVANRCGQVAPPLVTGGACDAEHDLVSDVISVSSKQARVAVT